MIVRINGDPSIPPIFVGGPGIGAEFFYQVHGIFRDMEVEPLHDVNPLPYRIGSLGCGLDVKPKAVDFFDALGFCRIGHNLPSPGNPELF